MLDSIKWGNPSREHLPYLENNKSFLDKNFQALSEIAPPKSSSKATREELNMLVDYVNGLSKEEGSFLARYKQYDRNLEQVFAQVISERQFEPSSAELIDEITKDVTPLIYKLKYFFNRPRPNQLAASYKLKLFPYNSYSASSPSYPSAHTIYGLVICHVLGNHYPEHFHFLETLSKEIGYSRLYMGLNFQSDHDYSVFVAEKIIADIEFMQKYHL